MKIAIVIYCLRGGGAERVSSYLANSLVQGGNDVTVITELGPESDQYILNAGIGRAVIGAPGGGSRIRKSAKLVAKALRLRRELRRLRPDVTVAFMTRSNNLTLLATAGTGMKVVICERNDPRHNKERAGDETLRKLLYRRADLVVAQTETMAGVLRDMFGLARTVVIPNPSVVAKSTSVSAAITGLPAEYILAMGRLASQKGFDVLIRAYARTSARDALDLVIAGQGGGQERLEDIARAEGVGDRVHFIGHVDQPFDLLRQCRIFVLSSRYEGFPNVLLEAMSFARPVISTILPSGAHAMIDDGVNGLLVPAGDVDALAVAIDRLAGDRMAAEKMAARGPEAVAPFALSAVMAKWEDVLASVANGQQS